MSHSDPARALTLIVLAGLFVDAAANAEGGERTAPLFGDLGSHRMPVTTASDDAQRYFDQGLVLAYGFNHAEAVLARHPDHPGANHFYIHAVEASKTPGRGRSGSSR